MQKLKRDNKGRFISQGIKVKIEQSIYKYKNKCIGKLYVRLPTDAENRLHPDILDSSMKICGFILTTTWGRLVEDGKYVESVQGVAGADAMEVDRRLKILTREILDKLKTVVIMNKNRKQKVTVSEKIYVIG